MGIQVNDEFKTNLGFTVANMYVTFRGAYSVDKIQDVNAELEPVSTVRASSYAFYYKDQDAYNSGAHSIKHEMITYTVQPEDYSSGIISKLYDVLKTKFTSVVDC